MDSYDKHITTIIQVLTALNIRVGTKDDVLELYNKSIQEQGKEKIIELYKQFA